MTNEEILQLALKKAIKNGYTRQFLEEQVLIGFGRKYGKNNSISLWRNGWIMSHDFAKAFWGEEERGIIGGFPAQVSGIANWKFHLQKMVLEEDPIKYLERFLVPSEERK